MERIALVDQKDRDRAATDLDSNLVVEAGAGTGKTSVLIDRLFAILATGRARLPEIVAITFTEKAAGELKIRLRERLEEEERETALLELDRANVSTIHAFAASLLRERPVEAGIDPGFEQLDELGSQLLEDELWEQWMSVQMESAHATLKRSLLLGIEVSSLRAMASGLYENRDLLDASGTLSRGELLTKDQITEYRRNGVSACRRPDQELPIEDQITAQLTDYSETLQELSAACLDPNDNGYQAIQEFCKQVAVLKGLGGDDWLVFLHNQVAVKPKGNQKNWANRQAHEGQKELCRQAAAYLDDLKAKIRSGLAQAALNWLTDFVTFAQAEKERRGLLDFQDLLIEARDLLRDSASAREYFKRKFRYLLVDEFQDTDPLQVEIVFFLAEQTGDERHFERDWKKLELSPGKLFVVGDPKQSIYRFRRADIEIFEHAKRAICAEKPLNLVQNFRSLAAVIDWINATFKQLIQKADDYQPRYEELVAYAAQSGGGQHYGVPAVLLAGDLERSHAKMSDYRAAEADIVAANVARALEQQWPVRDRETGQIRSLERRDIAVLFPRMTNIELYEDALQRYRLRYHLEGGKQFFVRQEVRSLAACLGSIEDPSDGVALVAALRSAFFGFSDEDLFVFVSGGGKLNYLADPGEEWPGFQTACGLLRRLHEGRNRVPISQTVDQLLVGTRALQSLALQPYGDQAVANLLKVAEQARGFDRQGLTTFRRFARWIENMGTQERDEAESPLIEPDDDSLHVMTIHRAKGLEFPMVVIANLNFVTTETDKLIVDRLQGRLHLRLTAKAGSRTDRFDTIGFDDAEMRERLRTEAEQIRLFYVGTTRARDYLVLPVLGAERPQGFLKMLVESGPLSVVPGPLPGRGAAPRLPIDLEDSEDYDPMILLRRKRWKAELENTWEQARHGIEWTSATTEKAALWEQMETPAWGAADGTAFGAAFHAIMERADWRDQTRLESICRDRAAFFGVADHSALLLKLARNCLEGELVQRALQCGHYWKEMPFTHYDPPRLTEGAMDLVFREADGLVIVDFKTDQDPRRAETIYRLQAKIYADALEKIAGEHVKEVWFLFARSNDAVRLDLTKGQLSLF